MVGVIVFEVVAVDGATHAALDLPLQLLLEQLLNAVF